MRTLIRACTIAALLSLCPAGSLLAGTVYTETYTQHWTVEDDPYPSQGYVAAAGEPVVVAPALPPAPAVPPAPAPTPYRYYWLAPSY